MPSFGLDARIGAAVAAEVYLNGALVSEKAAGMMVAQSLAIQHDVVPGWNELVVIATGADVPAQAQPRAVDVDPTDYFVELELDLETVRDLGEEYRITAEPVEDRLWRPAAGAGSMVLPQRIALPFLAPPGTTAPVWQRATPVLVEAVQAGIAGMLSDMRALLVDRNFEAFQALMRLRNDDMARAYPLNGTGPARAARDTAVLRSTLADEAWQFPAIDPGRLIIRRFADGRIFNVRGADGAPPLRAVAEGQKPIFLSIGFASIDGRLCAIR